MLGGLLGDSSVLVIDDDVHRERRRLMLPPFHRDAVARQAEADGRDRRGEHRGLAGGPTVPGGAQDVRDHARGDPADGHRCERSGATRCAAGRDAEAAQRRSVGVVCDRTPGAAAPPPMARVAGRMQEADRLLYAEIAERRADPNLAERTDVLAMLVRATEEDGRALSDRELRDQLMTLLVAGHDTTATGLSWTLERLTRHPTILDKAVAGRRCGGFRWRRVSRRGGQGDAADPAGGIRRRPRR